MTKRIAAATGVITAMLVLTATRANGGGGVPHNRHVCTTLRPVLPLQPGG